MNIMPLQAEGKLYPVGEMIRTIYNVNIPGVINTNL